MSYANFKQKVWSKAIEKELERVCVFAENTNQSYTGEIKGIGDTVRIQRVGKPTVTTRSLVNGNITLSTPEEVEDTTVSLVIDTVSYFNYAVDDIDKAQGAGGVLSVLNEEASQECSCAMDRAIADLSKGSVGVQLYDANNTVITTDNILNVLDTCQQKLQENDVPASATITVTMPPWMFKVLKQAYEKLDTDNSDMIMHGKVAKYSNMIIKMSNNVAIDSDNHHYVQVKTDKAIAFAKGEPHVEPYRPEAGFKDAVKGFVLYGCKIVRPEEMITIECSPS